MAKKHARRPTRRNSSSKPRVSAKRKPAPTPLERKLRDAVMAHGNNFELAAAAGITPDILSRFTRKERTLRLPTAGKLAEVLGLTLTDEP